MQLGEFDNSTELVQSSLRELPPVEMENGATYAGTWNSHNQPHGRGILFFRHGSIIEGNWVNGMLNGMAR
jgi:hypothetical protein